MCRPVAGLLVRELARDCAVSVCVCASSLNPGDTSFPGRSKVTVQFRYILDALSEKL